MRANIPVENECKPRLLLQLTNGTVEALSTHLAAPATSPNIPRPAASIPTASHCIANEIIGPRALLSACQITALESANGY